MLVSDRYTDLGDGATYQSTVHDIAAWWRGAFQPDGRCARYGRPVAPDALAGYS